MSVTPSDLLQFAQELLEGQLEVSDRAAASRACYAALHSCRPVRESLPYAAGSRRGSHAEVIEDLMNYLGDPTEFQMRVRILGSLLKQLKAVREHADYDIADPFTTGEAASALKQAQNIASRAMQIRKK